MPISTSRSDFACGDLVVSVASDIGTFADIWPALSELESASDVRGFAFQCRDHLEVWLETIGSSCRVHPFFVAVKDRSGNPLLMIPLGVETHAGIRILGFLDGGVCDYNAPLIHVAATTLGKAEIFALWTKVCGAAPPFDVALLQKMPEFVGEFRNPLFVLGSENWQASGHYLRVGPNAQEDALQRKRDVADSRRIRKRISETGDLEFSIAREKSEIEKVFDVFVRQKSRRYMETLGTAGFDVPGQLSYYLTATQRLSGHGVQLSYLSVRGDVIATAWSLIAGRRFYYLMCAYEGGVWRKFSPGRLLLEELIGWSYRNGIEVFDLGIGDEAYKLTWRQTAIPLVSGMYPVTIAGQLYRAAVRFRQVLKRGLPPKLIKAAKSLARRVARRT